MKDLFVESGIYLAVSHLAVDLVSWKFTSGSETTFDTNSVSLFAIGEKLTNIAASFRLYHDCHWRDFPECLYLAFHAYSVRVMCV
jgi:hypothetical protein